MNYIQLKATYRMGTASQLWLATSIDLGRYSDTIHVPSIIPLKSSDRLFDYEYAIQ